PLAPWKASGRSSSPSKGPTTQRGHSTSPWGSPSSAAKSVRCVLTACSTPRCTWCCSSTRRRHSPPPLGTVHSRPSGQVVRQRCQQPVDVLVVVVGRQSHAQTTLETQS